MKKLVVGALLISGSLLLSACSTAEQASSDIVKVEEEEGGIVLQCGHRLNVVSQLAIKHQESRVVWGVNHTGSAVMELFATDDGATWSLIFTDANSWSCLMSGGYGLRIVKGEKVNTIQLLVE